MFHMFHLKKISLAVAVSVFGITSTAQAVEILAIEQETEQGLVQVQPETNVQEIEVDISAAEEPIVILSNSGEVEIEDIQEVPQPSDIVVTTPGIRAVETIENLNRMLADEKVQTTEMERKKEERVEELTGWLQEQFELAGCSVTCEGIQKADAANEVQTDEEETYHKSFLAVRSGESGDVHADILMLSSYLDLNAEKDASVADVAVLLETAREISGLSSNVEVWFVILIGEDGAQQAFASFAETLTELQKERMIAGVHLDLTERTEAGYQVAAENGVQSLLSDRLLEAEETVSGKPAELTEVLEKDQHAIAAASIPVVTFQVKKELTGTASGNISTTKQEEEVGETVLDEWIQILTAFVSDITSEAPQKLARANRASLVNQP